MQKALLILFGGRPSIPNMLTIIHEKPDLIVAIVSNDQKHQLPELSQSLEELFKDEKQEFKLDASYSVNAFSLEDVYQICLRVIKDYPHLEWIFNITAATKIMSLGAYRAATELKEQGESIKCWYLDTLHGSVVSLIGSQRNNDIFHITLEQYSIVYNAKMEPVIRGNQRELYGTQWLPFARFMVEHPRYIDVLKEVLLRMGGSPKKDGSKTCVIPSTSDETHALLENMYKKGLLESMKKEKASISVTFNHDQHVFLDGKWLEVYSWDVANRLRIFSDCQWEQRFPDEQKPKEDRNEIDVAMIYNAQLILLECKTSKDVFGSETIYKLDFLGNRLGGRFVTKILVTSLSDPNKSIPGGPLRGQAQQFADLRKRAKESRVVLATQEDLMTLGDVLAKQAKDPDYPRM